MCQGILNLNQPQE